MVSEGGLPDPTFKLMAVYNGDHPDHYFESYGLLKRYIEESLDMFREELHRVLFPIFVELFLGMITHEYYTEARRFFEAEKFLFHSGHKEDLSVLEQVDNISKLGIPEISKYLSNKFVVKVSIQSFQILIHFVKLKQLILIMNILNQNINFQLSSEKTIVDQLGPQSLLISENITELNQTELVVGKLAVFSPEALASNPVLTFGMNIASGAPADSDLQAQA